MLRIWYFKKSHTKLVFTCFMHMLEWYEEVWIRIVVLQKALFLREGHIWCFLHIVTTFHFKFTQLFYIMPCEGLCVYHWMITMTRKLTSTFSILGCSDTNLKFYDQIYNGCVSGWDIPCTGSQNLTWTYDGYTSRDVTYWVTWSSGVGVHLH